MKKEMQIILDHFFGKSRLEEIPVESIDELVSKYPYLNVARFLHVKKSAPGEKSEKHPGLFFNNPLWFEFLLQEQEGINDIPMQVELVVDRKDVVGALQDEGMETYDTGTSEVAGNGVTLSEPQDITSEQVLTGDAEISGSDLPDSGNSEEPGDSDSGNPDQPGDLNTNISRVIKQQSIQPANAIKEEDNYTFEPYHTIDYFASQGIRLQQADLSRDKFGKQLKSFTEWLKSMKRLPDPNQAPVDLEAQEKVVRIAEHSIENKDVYTEAMAEVWAKQGNYKKATDIYRKLSLINPAKSPYFAAKIEQLNNL